MMELERRLRAAGAGDDTWAEACRKAGLPALLFHDLRRSAVRNLERAGVSRSVAMKLTGHKTESVYRRYAIVAESDLRGGSAKLTALSDNFGDTLECATACNWPLLGAPEAKAPRGKNYRRSQVSRAVHRENCQSRGRGFKSRRARH
jgi:Phage integrase family